MNKFDEFRFEGLNARRWSNKYLTMNRVSEDENKIVVKVSKEQLFLCKDLKTVGVKLDRTHTLFVKIWQLSSKGFYDPEILLDKKFFNVKEFGNWENYSNDPENLKWETWLNTAKEQQEANTQVMW